MTDEAFLQQGAQALLAGQGLLAALVPPDAEMVIHGPGRGLGALAVPAALPHKVPDQPGFLVRRQKGLLRRADHQLAAAAEDALHLGHAGGAHKAGALHGAAEDALPQGRAQAQGRRIEVHGPAAGAPGHLIIALAAQAGQDFLAYPAAELPGLRLAAAENESIEAGLGNDGRLLLSADGVGNTDAILFILIELGYGIPVVCDF